MKKIDHVRKMVYIIVGILTIISLVFTICKKIGLCSSGFSDFPIPYGYDIGYGDFPLTQDLLDRFVQVGVNQGYTDIVVLTYETADAYIDVTIGTNSGVRPYGYSTVSDNFSRNNHGNFYLTSYGVYRYNILGDTITKQSSGSNSVLSTPNFQTFMVSDGGTFSIPSGQKLLNYPLYLFDDSYFSWNGVQYYSFSPFPTGPQPHTKGGVLGNYIDSEELLENSSDLPKVDTTPPADPSSNAGWFQKILNGIGRLNQSTQGGVLTLGDYIGAGFEKVIESITGIYNWFTEDFDKDSFENGLTSIPLISDLIGLKSIIENCGMFDWSDVSPAQSVSFTFDFGGSVLPHSTNTIDFSWYTGTVKTLCNAILCTFLVLGLLVTVVNQIPSIIGGHSGDKGGGSDS